MKVLRSSPDSQGIIVTSIYDGLPDDATVMLNVDCASTVQSGSPTITIVTFLTIAVCKRIDASNFCVQLPSSAQLGAVVEIYAQGGTIEVFPPFAEFSPGTFFDGSSSVSISTGARFRYIVTTDGSFARWAKID